MSNPGQHQSGSGHLVECVDALAARFRASGDVVRASAVESSLAGEQGQLPRRVLALFSRGMGGIVDGPLYRFEAPGSTGLEIDQSATDERDQLADQLLEEARRRL